MPHVKKAQEAEVSGAGQLEKLAMENGALREENERLHEKLAEQTAKIISLTNEVKALKKRTPMTNEELVARQRKIHQAHLRAQSPENPRKCQS